MDIKAVLVQQTGSYCTQESAVAAARGNEIVIPNEGVGGGYGTHTYLLKEEEEEEEE